jgi:hypothetical protein
MLALTNKNHTEKGQRMLYLFQRDLLPGVNGQILESKHKRDIQKPNVRTAGAKLGGWLFIALLNTGMLFYIMLFALQETKQRQSAWFRSFMLWLVLEILFVSTSVVYVTHILIPMVAMRDVNKIKNRLLATVRDHYTALKNARINHADDEASSRPDFNSAEYLFVSYRLAKLFPSLNESAIILRYSTVWPKQSYQHKVDVTKSYSKKFSAVTKALSMLMIFVISNLLSIPPTLQDMIIQIASTATIGYTILLHLDLFKIYPVLIVLPAVLMVIVVHFVLKGQRAQAKAELAKLMPVTEKVRQSRAVSLENIDIDVGTPASNALSTPKLFGPVGNPTFQTRRQSVVAGQRTLHEMLRLEAGNLAVDSETKSEVENDHIGAVNHSSSEDDHEQILSGSRLAELAQSLNESASVPSTLTQVVQNTWFTRKTDAEIETMQYDSDVIGSESSESDETIELNVRNSRPRTATSQVEDSPAGQQAIPTPHTAESGDVSSRYISFILSQISGSGRKHSLDIVGDSNQRGVGPELRVDNRPNSGVDTLDIHLSAPSTPLATSAPSDFAPNLLSASAPLVVLSPATVTSNGPDAASLLNHLPQSSRQPRRPGSNAAAGGGVDHKQFAAELKKRLQARAAAAHREHTEHLVTCATTLTDEMQLRKMVLTHTHAHKHLEFLKDESKAEAQLKMQSKLKSKKSSQSSNK